MERAAYVVHGEYAATCGLNLQVAVRGIVEEVGHRLTRRLWLVSQRSVLLPLLLLPLVPLLLAGVSRCGLQRVLLMVFCV